MWQLGTCFSGGLDSAGLVVVLHDVRCLFQPKCFSVSMCINQKHKIVVHRLKLKLLIFIILKKQNLSYPLPGIPASALPYINYRLIHSTGWVESRKVCATYIFLIISHSEEKNQNIAMDYFIWESSLCKDVLWWYVRVWFLLKWEESTSSEFNHPPGSLVDPEWKNQQTRTLFHCCRGVIPK